MFLLPGGSPTTLVGTESVVSSTSATEHGNFASVPTDTADHSGPGTKYSSAKLVIWPASSTRVVSSQSLAAFVSASAVESAVISASSSPGRSTSRSARVLSTHTILALAVGTAGLLAVIAVIFVLLARYKYVKDRQCLRDSRHDEKFPNNGSTPTRPKDPITPSSQPSGPFGDGNSVAKPGPRTPKANRRRLRSDITYSFDFDLVPTKNNSGKDGNHVIAPVSDERDVGRPLVLGQAPSPANSMVADIGAKTLLHFASRSKTLNPSKDSAVSGSHAGTPQSNQTIPTNSSGACPHLVPTAALTKQVTGQERQLPISEAISPFDEASSLSSKTSSVVETPRRGEMARSTDSKDAMVSTTSSIPKPRPAPIQVPPPKMDSRDCIVIDKSASPPLTSPPSIPTPPLPSLEFRKDWERLKRDSGETVESTNTSILDEVSEAPESKPNAMTTTKGPLQPRSDALNLPSPARNESHSKAIPRTPLQVVSPEQGPTNAGDILKGEKSMLPITRVPSSIASSSNSSISSANGPAANPNIKRFPSAVAATAKWAEKRKAPNGTLAKEHNVRDAAATRSDPLLNNAIEKVEDARKPLQGLVPSPVIEENRDWSVARKRKVAGRKGARENATESVGSPTLSVFKCYDPERESTFVPGEAPNMIHALQLGGEDKENPSI